MYAIIESGSKQHKVQEGAVVKLEKIEIGVGETLDLEKVLLLENNDGVKIGTPYVDGAKVTAEVVGQGRHKKVNIIKFRRRKHSMKSQGHRQYFTAVRIVSIQG